MVDNPFGNKPTLDFPSLEPKITDETGNHTTEGEARDAKVKSGELEPKVAETVNIDPVNQAATTLRGMNVQERVRKLHNMELRNQILKQHGGLISNIPINSAYWRLR